MRKNDFKIEWKNDKKIIILERICYMKTENIPTWQLNDILDIFYREFPVSGPLCVFIVCTSVCVLIPASQRFDPDVDNSDGNSAAGVQCAPLCASLPGGHYSTHHNCLSSVCRNDRLFKKSIIFWGYDLTFNMGNRKPWSDLRVETGREMSVLFVLSSVCPATSYKDGWAF